MRARRVLLVLVPALALGTAAVAWGVRSRSSAPAPLASLAPPPPLAGPDGAIGNDQEDRAPFTLRMPSGEPSGITCDAARSVVAQVRGGLAYDPPAVAPLTLATSTTDWLDPHGLWSAAPDAPIQGVVEKHAAALLRDLEGENGGKCAAALEIGRALVPWTDELARRFDREKQAARTAAKDESPEALARAAGESPFEDDAPARSARELATLLGQRIGSVEAGLGDAHAPFATVARARFFPPLDAEGWQRVVLAAAVRAYVQVIDPHGAWAPTDEEASVYEMDLESPAPARLWERASRTAVGFVLEADPVAPLKVGDVVLSVAGLATAGLPLEQVEQLDYAAADADGPITAVVLRKGERALRELTIGAATDEGSHDSPSASHDLLAERIPYGSGDALVVSIHDVRDDLGDELPRVVASEREADRRPIEGLVLDLRGNGGGSTEGAIAALGMFVPGAPLFPMKRRDGTVETDRAPEPPGADRWPGPVATLVDGDTASAAEMIAGALAVYHRGPSVGVPTYGKGCAQEYLDDEAETGILRLTTLLYALPDGSPVQRVGLVPSLLVGWSDASPPPHPVEAEREATLSHAPPTWRGPDVRDTTTLAVSELVVWPQNGGTIGPCKDPEVCRALRALGSRNGSAAGARAEGILGAPSKRPPIAKGGGPSPARSSSPPR